MAFYWGTSNINLYMNTNRILILYLCSRNRKNSSQKGQKEHEYVTCFYINEKIINRQAIPDASINATEHPEVFHEKASNPHKIFKAVIYPPVNSGNRQMLSLATLLHAQGQPYSPH